MLDSDVFTGAAPLWVSGTLYQQFKVLQSPADGQLYVRTGATGSGAADPSADATNYRPFGGRAIKSIQRGSLSANYTANPTNTRLVTISPVNTAKSVLTIVSGGYQQTVSGTYPGNDQSGYSITSTSVIQNVNWGDGSYGHYVSFSWQVVEYF